MNKSYFLILAAFAALLFTSCSETQEQNETKVEAEPAPEPVWSTVDSFNFESEQIRLVKVDNQGVETYMLKSDSLFGASYEVYQSAHGSILTDSFETIQWKAKAYPDLKFTYRTKAEYSHGNNSGGWMKEIEFVAFFDGKTGERYFVAEPYSYNFEEHTISNDTTHPLAAVSCFFQYNMDIKPEKNILLISNLEGSCLPDYEEGLYKFANNQLVLTKD